MSTLDTTRFRTLLVEERERLAHAAETLEAQEPKGDDLEAAEVTTVDHIGDSASETLERQIDDALEENAYGIIAQIDDALERIEAGTYGTCRVCGKPIPEERLEVKPYASLCIEHQRLEERG